MSTTMTSALFPDQAAAITDLRAWLSMGAGQYINLSAVTDDMLWDKLMAAESEAERSLRVFFSPTEVVPDNAPQAEIDALEAAKTRYVTVSNFDYEPDLFLNDAWGYVQLAHKPIQAIRSVIIAFPTPFLQNYQVPADWLRLDRKYGQLQFVPTSTAAVTPVGAYAVAMWGGSIYPQALQIRYLCGLTNANGQAVTSFAQHWNDLVDVVKRMAISKLMKTGFLPTSSSISADGLSQSNSFDMAAWQDGINESLFGPKGSNGGLFASIHGITSMVG
jgi:hypothetical protein